MGFHQSPDQIYRVAELDAIPWLIHGFGTRHSDIPGIFANLATVKQIHSATCLFAEGRGGVIGEGDALLENSPGAVVAVKTADCVPLLLVDERQRAVGAVHSGWRGTAAGIARRAMDAMRQRFGTCAGDLHAAIGPAIGACCYEVGPEVAAEFGQSGRVHLDLAAEIRRQLLEEGVTAQRIYASNLCTQCHLSECLSSECLSSEFHSFRRDHEASGRMFSFAGIVQAVD